MTARACALWFAAPRVAELRPASAPPPGPDEVRIRTLASAPSGGTEMLVYRGEVSPELPLDLPTLEGGFGFPVKHGYAAVGRVVDAGGRVRNLAPGDAVFVHHPHQSAFTVPASLPVRLPGGLDPVLGVFAANLETAVNVVHDTPLRFGETAVVFGQGVVGLLVVQLLRLAGAGRVLAVDPLENRRELALAAGADDALEPDGELGDQVLSLTDGRGADVAVEASGSGAALGTAIEAVATEGTVVVASWYGAGPVALPLGGNFHRGRVTLRSSQVGRLSPGLAPRWDPARRMRTVMDLLRDPRMVLWPLVSHRIPFGRAPEAYRRIDERPEETAQVVLTYDGEP